MEKNAVKTDQAPAAIGPYSQAVQIGELLFTSGQLPLDTDGFIAADIESQTRQSLTNIKNILEAAGSGMDKVIKTTVFLYDMNDFAKMNEVYASFFTAPYPARSAIQAARLPKDARIEIEAIAVFPKLL